MSNPPTPSRVSIDIEKAREICDAASPGPWTIHWTDLYEGDSIPPIEEACIDQIDAANGERIIIADSGVYPPRGNDATFIAFARSFVPEAIEEIERLREENELLDKLLVCYRLGERPNGRLLDRLAAIRAEAE